MFARCSSRARAVRKPVVPFSAQEYTRLRQQGIQALVQDHHYDRSSLIEQEIRWGNTDAFQHVNNVRTFEFFESGRINFIQSLLPDLPEGSEQSLVQGKPGGQVGGVILSDIHARYKRPVTFPDTLLVGHKVLSISKDRFTLDCVCWSLKQQKIVTTGEAVMVCYDYGKLRRMDMPEILRAALEKRKSTCS
ncbi:hypothetical protein OIV83_006227 [Microbotryomycetes sp. JL201]|nr:hypothetical protein OIV83_006227 [Microbotryomycetes sp. JL201]